eukprot:733039-Pyramimonas_sp.AAC.2
MADVEARQRAQNEQAAQQAEHELNAILNREKEQKDALYEAALKADDGQEAEKGRTGCRGTGPASTPWSAGPRSEVRGTGSRQAPRGNHGAGTVRFRSGTDRSPVYRREAPIGTERCRGEEGSRYGPTGSPGKTATAGERGQERTDGSSQRASRAPASF